MVDNELLIEIKGSAKEFVEALEEVKGKTGSLENQLKLTAGVSAAAFAVFSAEIGFATAAFGKQEAATNKLSAALQAQGIYSDGLVESYKASAEAIERKTGADAEAIVRGQAIFTSMAGQVQISDKLNQAAVDLAATMGGDVTSSFELIARAVNGHARELQRMGIEVDTNADRQTRLAQVTEQLSQRFGGAAAAANQGLGGIKGLHAAFEDLQKHLGAEFAPAIEKAIQGMTHFLQAVADHQGLITLIANMVAIGAVISGTVLSFATAGLAIQKFTEVMNLAKIATQTMGIATRGLVAATGLGLLLLIAAEIYANWNVIWPRMYGAYKSFVDNISQLAGGLGTLLVGAMTFNVGKIQEGWDKVKAALSNDMKEYAEIVAGGQRAVAAETDKHHAEQNAKQKAFADAAAAKAEAEETRKRAARAAQRSVLLAEINNESDAIVSLKKKEAELLAKIADENYKEIRGKLQASLAQTRRDRADQQALELEEQKKFHDDMLSSSEAYRSMSASDQQKFLRENQNSLRAEIQTEQTTRNKAAKDELDLQIKTHNTYLENQRKFGTAYATIYKGMHSEIYEGSKSAFGNLAELTQSSNSTLKGIGKAAAVANIIIKTAESAMNIFAGFSVIPFIGPELGLAAAAAAIAYGAEQIGNVVSAATGGLITGGIPGMDSVPAMLMPGEFVVPSKNYDEVINAVAGSRISGSGTAPDGGAGNGIARIELSLKDQLVPFVEAKITERRNLKISLLPA